MANQDTIQKTLTVALLLCFVCSVIVSTAAVLLRPMQDANKDQDRKKNILLAAGLYQEGIEIDEQFVVYCSDSDCGSSEDLSYEFQSIGFSNILLFKGGWQEWVDADYPQVQNE